MEMDDQYGMADLRQLMNGRPHFSTIAPPQPPTAELFSGHHHHHRSMAAPSPPTHQYEMLMMGREMMPRGGPSLHHPHDNQHHHHHHQSQSQFTSPDYSAAVAGAPAAALNGSGVEAELACLGGDSGTGRWPRQETLTLLEIRSRLDPKFKEANQKGPLWDEVSRIMSEEHGYQRSGKKCREKFENLYKYYKKTKEGKAGRQDGKHYRFFRQLEALYGGDSTNSAATCDAATHIAAANTHHHNRYLHHPAAADQDAFQATLSLSTSSELDTSSSDEYTEMAADNDSEAAEKGKKRRGGGGRRSWKAKVREFIDGQMRRLMEKQESWLEKMLRTLENKERERMMRDEEWRRQEASRLDREHRFWASERAWIKSRDAALLEALQKFNNGGGDDHQQQQQQQRLIMKHSSPEELMVAPEIQNDAENGSENGWCESEVTKLIELRTGMEARFRQGGCPEEVLWEEIAAEMACFGHEKSGSGCKEKWDGINEYIASSASITKASSSSEEGSRKRKEGFSLRSECYFPVSSAAAVHNTVEDSVYRPGSNDDSSPPSNSNHAVVVQDGCFRFLMADGGESLWDNYGMKLKGENQHH